MSKKVTFWHSAHDSTCVMVKTWAWSCSNDADVATSSLPRRNREINNINEAARNATADTKQSGWFSFDKKRLLKEIEKMRLAPCCTMGTVSFLRSLVQRRFLHFLSRWEQIIPIPPYNTPGVEITFPKPHRAFYLFTFVSLRIACQNNSVDQVKLIANPCETHLLLLVVIVVW